MYVCILWLIKKYKDPENVSSFTVVIIITTILICISDVTYHHYYHQLLKKNQKWIISYSSFSCQTLLLQIGVAMLEEEAQKAAEEKRKYLEEQCPTLSIPDCMQSLQVNLAQ